jgi:hypothetical protein
MGILIKAWHLIVLAVFGFLLFGRFPPHNSTGLRDRR